MDLTARQIKLLQIIIETYAISALPVSSEDIKQKNMTDLSSATIRNEMLALEKVGFLEKTHTSSGRIPAIAGYKFYQQNILQPKINTDIKHKLEKIFANRELSIDTVIDQSVQIINESFKLPLLISKEENESLKRFDLIRLNEHHALIIVVSSSGKINKNIIEINSDIQFDDIAICIRVFNDRLIDTPIMQVTEKLNSIKQIIKMAVQQYEFCIRQVVERIFDLKIISTNTKVTGTKYLTSQPEFQDLKKLNEVLTFLEDTNV
jgi:heat-inducible transcriptional repressor